MAHLLTQIAPAQSLQSRQSRLLPRWHHRRRHPLPKQFIAISTELIGHELLGEEIVQSPCETALQTTRHDPHLAIGQPMKPFSISHKPGCGSYQQQTGQAQFGAGGQEQGNLPPQGPTEQADIPQIQSFHPPQQVAGQGIETVVAGLC